MHACICCMHRHFPLPGKKSCTKSWYVYLLHYNWIVVYMNCLIGVQYYDNTVGHNYSLHSLSTNLISEFTIDVSLSLSCWLFHFVDFSSVL